MISADDGAQVAFRRRLFYALGSVGTLLGLVSGTQALLAADRTGEIWPNFGAAAIALTLMWYVRRSTRENRFAVGYILVVAVVFAGGFGALFFAADGLFGAMPAYFMLAFVFTSLMFDGRRVWILVTALTAVYCILFVVAFTRYTAHPPELDTEWFVSYLTGFALAVAAVVVAVTWQVRLYRANQAALAAHNRVLEQLDRARVEFLGNVAHELKTPLAVIAAYAQDSSQAIASGARPEDVAADLRTIATHAERLGLMVSQLLDAARIDEGKLTVTPRREEVAAIVQDTLDTYGAMLTRHGNRIEVHPGPPVPPVMGDPPRIAQVLINLLVNASRHTHGGRITISARQAGGMVEVSVADTGEGIAPEHLDGIFERYRTMAARTPASQVDTRHPADTGIGLGLFISRHIITAHGGQIAIRSALGEGTTVTFTLPPAPAEPGPVGSIPDGRVDLLA
ncbi:MAG: HAMP domain-containing histidine kinase [Bifidobacteriaceae bacterium]|jgi:signal transduction histidine kinase|nr:HAMP domain-containing histidine kinase [Bifidobacteriaceae bacterium]